MKERKALLDDARAATQAALEEGIVPGGGVALLRCKPAIEKLEASVEGDEKLGVRIIKNVLDQPLRAIANNAGLDGAVVVNRVSQMKGKSDGYDANAEVYCDLIQAGIVDPAKVVRTSLTNAASVAGLLLTTESCVCDIRSKPKKAVTITMTTAWWHGRNGRHGWHGRNAWHDVGRQRRIVFADRSQANNSGSPPGWTAF